MSTRTSDDQTTAQQSHAHQPTAEQLYDARGWLLDCGFSDELIFDLTDRHIIRFVEREYDGGWPAFVLDNTGHIIARLPLVERPFTTTDALAQWTVMIAKADALGLLTEDTDTSASGGTL
ncbi:hypothetical protein [Rhodococcus sp. KRD197]|uniref:hypothetical protein n=1 Tax=Rhodococcus sp. KRD197 TaxID=2729731 RepID=UPI0019CFDA51|nr:hypothetical protein [Rhodococcus sp. KRD197]